MIPVDRFASSPPIHTDLIVRRAKIGDGEAIWKLAQASVTAAHWEREAFQPYFATETAAASPQAKALLVACMSATAGDTSSDLATGEVVGFAAFSAIAGFDQGECMLENMAVAGPWQRRGIGGRLLFAGTLWCRAHSAQWMFLEVRESNQAAIALYRREGFLPVGRRLAYYREPEEAALQMRKILVPVTVAG